MGSAAGVSTKIRGIHEWESTYDAVKSNGGGSTNSFPKFSEIKIITNIVCNHQDNL